jgi:hypothetical protein
MRGVGYGTATRAPIGSPTPASDLGDTWGHRFSGSRFVTYDETLMRRDMRQ